MSSSPDPTSRRLIDALADPASPGVTDLVDDRVRFRSPFADYVGRGDVAHLVGLIREVLVDLRPARQLDEGTTTMSVFDARVADGDVQGVLCEERDEEGLLIDAMLTIRPYAGLRAAMRAMQALLEAAPLPSAQAR